MSLGASSETYLQRLSARTIDFVRVFHTRDVRWADHRHGTNGETADESTDVELGEVAPASRLDDGANEENGTADHESLLSSDPGGQGRTEECTKEAIPLVVHHHKRQRERIREGLTIHPGGSRRRFPVCWRHVSCCRSTVQSRARNWAKQ